MCGVLARIASIFNCIDFKHFLYLVNIIAFITCLSNFTPYYSAVRTLAGKVGRLKRKADHPVVAIRSADGIAGGVWLVATRCCHLYGGWRMVLKRMAYRRATIAGAVFGGHPFRVVARRRIYKAVSVARKGRTRTG